MAASTITWDELSAARQNAGDALTLVETLPAPFFRHTHLPGAINLPPDEIDSLAPTLLPDKDAAIVVYCAGPT